MEEESKRKGQSCLLLIAWVIGAPVALALVADGHGDWIIGGVMLGVFAVAVVLAIGGLLPPRR